MSLHLFLMGVERFLTFTRKALFVVVVFVVVLVLFGTFRKMDNKGSESALAYQKQAAARRVQIYADMDEKKDKLFTEQDVLARRFERAVSCFAMGELCSSNPSDVEMYRKESLNYKMASVVALPFKTPPSSFLYIAKNSLENSGFVPKTYAAGIGFYALSSFQPIWKAFRDLAYLVIVIVILVVGFMVMFGIGGGGKTSVSLETALPRLVIALLAIAFSYAIAGFFIDIMYISIILVVSLLGGQAGMTAVEQGKLASQLITGAPQDLFLQMLGNIGHSDTNYWNLATSIYNIVPNYMQATVDGIANIVAGTLLGSMLTMKFKAIGIKDITSNPGMWVNSWGRILSGIVPKFAKLNQWLDAGSKSGGGLFGISTVALLINIVISVIVQAFLGPIITKTVIMTLLILSMVIVVFRVMFALFYIYLDILLAIMFAPVLLMFEAIPGQNAFVKWMKGLLINLSVFPFFAALMLVIRIIMSNGNPAPMWSPPFVAVISDQLSLQMVIGGVLLYSVPQILKFYRQKLGAESMMGSLNLGVGAMFVGAAPIITGVSTTLGASGISQAMAKRMTAPLRNAFDKTGDSFVQTVKQAVPPTP
ncbi:MAG: hypothetical protein U0525_00005 [Patescibacteria group bacterium]